MSAGFLRAHGPLFHQVFAERRVRGILLRMSCIMAASAAGMLWFSHAVVQRPVIGAAVCCLAIVVLMLMVAGMFASSAVRQNQPSNACLVPHLRRRLLTCCVVLFVAGSVVTAGAIGLFFGHFGYALAGAGLIFPVMLFAQRFVGLVFLPSALCMLFFATEGPWMERLFAQFLALGEPVVAVFGVALDILLLVWGLRTAFPQGGEAHWAWHQRLDKARAMTPKNATTLTQERMWIWRVGYARALRRDSTLPVEPGRRMMHVLGATVSEGVHVLSVVGFSLVGAVVLLSGVDFKISSLVTATSLLQMSVLLSVQSYASLLLSAAVARSDEQGLYRLAPTAPASPDFNRAFARVVLYRFLRLWGVLVACLVGIDFASTRSLVPSGSTFALAALVLPFACPLLRDYARLRASPSNWFSIIGSLVSTAVVLTIIAVAKTHPDFPWLMMAAAIAVITLFVLWVRWQDMMKAPPPFPAGRMAD